jgi:hypothetical protein
MKRTPPYPSTARPMALRVLALLAAVCLALTMAVNMMIAQLLGNSVNSFTWNKPASQ